MRTPALLYFYCRRLRVHAIQELLAGIGVAIAVALVFAVMVANDSITSSSSNVLHAVIGPANLQLHARGPNGLDERLLGRVQRLPGVARAAPLLEQTATVVAPDGRRVTLILAGTDIGLAQLDGLSHTLPIKALEAGGIGLSQASASALGLPAYNPRRPIDVRLELRGRAAQLQVSAVLGPASAGELAQAQVAVMPLAQLQRLAGLQGTVTRIPVQSKPGYKPMVERELHALAAGRITLAPADQDISLLHQALQPSSQASALFAGLSALLGFLFAFDAMLLTVPERREAIADLRLDGTRRMAIVQMVLFQALCLGVVACLAGLLGGYALSTGFFHQSPVYLAKAFTLGTDTVIGTAPVVLAFAGGMLATFLASVIPLQDLRRGRPLDAVFSEDEQETCTPVRARRWLIAVTSGLILLATCLFLLVPSAQILACITLALATMLAVPLVLDGVLRAAGALAVGNPRLTVLPLALASLRTMTLRSLALAATGSVALFGSVALGASREDLLRGIDGSIAHYVDNAGIWLINPTDNQAIDSFSPDGRRARIARLPGVAGVDTFQGSYLNFAGRRIWMIAWPPDRRLSLLDNQIIRGNPAVAATGLRPGQITVSNQIADERHLKIGGTLALATPTGTVGFTVAAITTNFGWSPGAILMRTGDYQRAWASTAPSALGVNLKPGASSVSVRNEIERALGPGNGLEVLTAKARELAIDHSASEALWQLGAISTMLIAAAVLAMAAALGSSIWQRRKSLAELRLEGAPGHQIKLVLLTESALMLNAGCLTGAIAGIYGQSMIDSYLKQVTGFPVAGVATSGRPIEIFVLVIAAVLLIVSLPAWIASRVPATLALYE